MIEEKEEKYNGWTNRETWALYLWLTSEEGLYNAVLSVIEANDDIYDKEDDLKEFVEDLRDKSYGNKELKTMFDDVGSLWRVDWEELTRAFIDE